jgi:hypothetical protein
MIKRKTKLCRRCGKFKYLFGRGLCDSCYKVEFPTVIKGKKKPNIISQKQKERNKKYLELRYNYLRANPICEVEGCTHAASEVHHKRGRIGDALYSDFLAVCHDCHVRIEENPEWAKEHGYSISRLNK